MEPVVEAVTTASEKVVTVVAEALPDAVEPSEPEPEPVPPPQPKKEKAPPQPKIFSLWK